MIARPLLYLMSVSAMFNLLASAAIPVVAQSVTESRSPVIRPRDDGQLQPVRQGPELRAPGEHGIGSYVRDVAFTDVSGRQYQLGSFRAQKFVVVAMTSTSCPISRKYLPTLKQLATEYSERGVQFVLVNPIATDQLSEMREVQQRLGNAAVYVFDQEESLATAMRATTTTDVVVLDSSRTVVYHGAIDDQYGFGYSIADPRRRYLADALDAVLEGRRPLVTATSAPGCRLDIQSVETEAEHLTWHARISRLVQRHCLECHRDGGVAPFALDRYADVVSHAPMIREVVERGVMPPWFAVANKESGLAQDGVSPWINDRSLSTSEKRDLLAWVGGGKAEGNPDDAPEPRTFPDGWLIGKPDAVFEFAEPVQVKATGTMPYQNVTVETNLPEDKWVQAIEVRPGNPGVVHHVLVFALAGNSPDSEGSGRDSAADERSGYWGIYVPGNSRLVYPDGYAKRLPQGARLRFQMHYTPNGMATEDRTRIGLVFAKQPPEHEVRVAGIVNTRISIPPGAADHQEVATLRSPTDARLLAFLPHMHLRGKAARYELITSKGTETLLDIPRYDFNWQLLYRYAEPLTIKQGDTIRFTAWFDNSDGNPANPDSSRTVRWGPQTEDEMLLGYVEYIVPGSTPGEAVDGMRRAQAGGAIREAVDGALFRRLDANADGFITREEVRERMPDNAQAAGAIFDRLDRDGNGKLDRTEFEALRNQQQR